MNTRLIKKQKESTLLHTVTSALFHDIKDQKQFQELFECVHSSKLFIGLGIYKDVSKHIAKFATGGIHECVDCQEEISTLPSDKPDTNVTIKEYDYCVSCGRKIRDGDEYLSMKCKCTRCIFCERDTDPDKCQYYICHIGKNKKEK